MNTVGSEVLLYIYGVICLSMIGFNLVYGLMLRGSRSRMQRRCHRFKTTVNEQLDRLSQGQPLKKNHTRWLGRKLSHTYNLMAFDQMLDQLLWDQRQGVIRQYLLEIRGVILGLAITYSHRESLQAAYFAYFLYRHKIAKFMPIETIQKILVGYMEKDSLYCRVNALKALCAFGSPEHILQAVTVQDQGVGFLHDKILTECLLTYSGDSTQLIQLFWDHWEEFSSRTKLALLNYIRFKSGDYCEKLSKILNDPKEDRELRFAAIRYFGRYSYPPVKEKLLEFAKDPSTGNWEYAAISATALANYPGDDVVRVLVEAMHNRNWYVRYNAAASLEARHPDHRELFKLVGTQDRYAREMILYRMESCPKEKALEKKGDVAV